MNRIFIAILVFLPVVVFGQETIEEKVKAFREAKLQQKQTIAINQQKMKEQIEKGRLNTEAAKRKREELLNKLNKKEVNKIVIRPTLLYWKKDERDQDVKDYLIYHTSGSLENTEEIMAFLQKEIRNGRFVKESKTKKLKAVREDKHDKVMEVRTYKETFTR